MVCHALRFRLSARYSDQTPPSRFTRKVKFKFDLSFFPHATVYALSCPSPRVQHRFYHHVQTFQCYPLGEGQVFRNLNLVFLCTSPKKLKTISAFHATSESQKKLSALRAKNLTAKKLFPRFAWKVDRKENSPRFARKVNLKTKKLSVLRATS